MSLLQLRQSLTGNEHETIDPFLNHEDGNEDNGNDTGMPNFEQPDDDMPENIYMDEDVPLHKKMVRLTLFPISVFNKPGNIINCFLTGLRTAR